MDADPAQRLGSRDTAATVQAGDRVPLAGADTDASASRKGRQAVRLLRFSRDHRDAPHDDIHEFEQAYLEQLERIGAARIVADLTRIGVGRPCICLCWEKPHDEFCRRWTLAAFLEREAGITVPGLKARDLLRRKDVEQRSSF